MEKHLIRFGNSLGLVVDRSICRLLGLTPKTTLHVSTDGRRIVIEPEHPPAMLATEQVDVKNLVSDVANVMPRELHQQLHPGFTGRRPSIQAIIWADRVSYKPRAGDELFARRYAITMQTKRAGASWEDAVAKAVRDVPIPEAILEAARVNCG